AVAGGAAAGFFAVGGLLRFVSLMTLRRKPQGRAANLVRYLGMIVFGMLVYFWAFGAGGGGVGGAAGCWPFGGQGAMGNAALLTGQRAATKEDQESRKVIAREKLPAEQIVQIRLLGGKEVVEQRFYQVDQEKKAQDWDELIGILKKRMQTEPGIKLIEISLE